MTPQAFSYPVIGNNGIIYVPPYGLNKSIDYMIKFNPADYSISKIPLDVDDSVEKWATGIVHNDFIIFLPYNESKLIVLDTRNDQITYVPIEAKAKGKYISGHIYNNTLYALPYGEDKDFEWVLRFDLDNFKLRMQRIFITVEDAKRWHTTEIVDGVIHGLPRGENPEMPHFNYRIEYDCENEDFQIYYIGDTWVNLNEQRYTNKKYTTIAKVGNKLYAPPYSENPDFDYLAMFNGKVWRFEKTGQTSTSRKYFSHTVAANGKIYFPPAGHDEDWSEMLIVDANNDTWYTKDLGIGKESKKYFTGAENSQGKIYYIPRGGCVCEPEETWKSQGDLAEVLVIDTQDDSTYTIDISEYFKDNTTIEKYNHCVILEDIIYAFPYGESDSFQTVLVFDTLKEQVIKTVDLNEL